MSNTALQPPPLEFRAGTFTSFRDGRLCIVWQDYHHAEPLMFQQWWDTGISMVGALSYIGHPDLLIGVWDGDFDRAREVVVPDDWDDGTMTTYKVWLRRGNPGNYDLCRARKTQYDGYSGYGDIAYFTIRLPEGGQQRAFHSEQFAVPEPKQRGKRLETRWGNRGWEKLTRDGWRLA